MCILLWFPVHVFLLPYVGGQLLTSGTVTEGQANLLVYGIGGVYMFAVLFSFLRREFDPLCDNLLYCAAKIFSGYLLMLALNMAASYAILALEGLIGTGTETVENLNNDAIIELAGREQSATQAMAVYLAPVLEEILFRGGIFCAIRGRIKNSDDDSEDKGENTDGTDEESMDPDFGLITRIKAEAAAGKVKKRRIAAYVVSILVFSLYHIWQYALYDPHYWLYILQYIPAGYVLCRTYERTDTIWAPIFLHMLNNGMALKMLQLLQQSI